MSTGLELGGSISAIGVDEGARALKSGLLLPDKLSFEAWRQIGSQLFLVTSSSAWWVGDWLSYGENCFGDRYEQAIADTSLNYQTLRNYAWVARKFTMSRRRDNLSFGHHAEVAALTEKSQDEWLTRAEQFTWSRNELRRQIRVTCLANRPQSLLLRKTETMKINVPVDHLDRWRHAAERMGYGVTEWMMAILDKAALEQ